MKTRWLVWVGLFGVAAVTGWHLTTWATPRLIMKVAFERLAERAGGVNRMGHAPPTSPESQMIVRPSPDLLYSICAFDLTQGDIEVRIGQTQGYWSASVYDQATNNFYLVSHRDFDPTTQALRLSITPAPAAIRSPSARGVILVRRRMDNEAVRADALRAQLSDTCSVVP
jgi:uncharacterized membrane protein